MNRLSDTQAQSSRKSKIYILPTRYGYIFICVLLAMLLGSVNYNNNLGFLLTFLLGGMATVSIVHSFQNIARVRIVGVQTRPVFAGENAVFEISLRADPLASDAVQLALGSSRTVPREVESGAETRVRISMATQKRGLLDPGDLTVYSRYPFGIFRAWSRMPMDIRGLVYPRPMRGPFVSAGDSSSDGSSGRSIAGGVDDFQGLKSYQPGDRLQHISWKTFSRGQGVFTKQFVGVSGSSKMLDWDSLTEPEVEKKISRLCGMVLFAHRRQWTFGLNIPGRSIHPGRGEAHRQNCLKALALFPTEKPR